MSSICYRPTKLSLVCSPGKETHLAICYFVSSHEYQQLHVGFLVVSDEGLFKFGDVGFHHLCGLKEIDVQANVYYWERLGLSSFNQELTAIRLETFLEENANKLPYSVEHVGLTIKDNIWVGNDPGQGLTCATFVSEYLKSSGFALIDAGSWREREGDDDWKRTMLKLLRRQNPPPSEEHIAAQERRIGSSVRVRPSDIASAASMRREYPLKFDDVAGRALCIENRLLGRVPRLCAFHPPEGVFR